MATAAQALVGLPSELVRLWPLVRVSWFQAVELPTASRRAKRQLQVEAEGWAGEGGGGGMRGGLGMGDEEWVRRV